MYCNIFKLVDDASSSNEIVATCILNCIYVRLLLHPFMVVTSSLKWTKLHSSSHLFLKLTIPYLGKLCWEKVLKFWTSPETFP